MISLKKADYEKILAHAKSCVPEEACGLIAGTKDGEEFDVMIRFDDGSDPYYYCFKDEGCHIIYNEHFTLDLKEQLAAVKDMRANGLMPLGNWHSHPESPSRPSEEDKRLAYDSKASYMILSLMEPEQPVLNSFHIEGDESTKEDLVIC